MTVYYIITSKGQVGCFRQDKLSNMYPGFKHYYCDISDFKGHLLGSEWNG